MNLYLKDIDKFKRVLLLVTVFSLLLIGLSYKNYYDNKQDGDYGYNIIYPEGKNIRLNNLNASINKSFDLLTYNNTNKDVNCDLEFNIKNQNLDLDNIRITLENNGREYNVVPKEGSFFVSNIIIRKNTKLKKDKYNLNIRYLDSEPIFGDSIEDSIGTINEDSNLELSINLK